MNKKIIILLILTFAFPIQAIAQKKGGGGGRGKGSRSIMASAGLSSIDINGNLYSGYDAFAKILFPLRNRFLIGAGIKYDQTTHSLTTTDGVKNDYTFKTMHAGVDLGYKYSVKIISLLANPFFYYGLSNDWTKVSSASNQTETINPKVKTTFSYGAGVSALINVKRFFFGPSVYYTVVYTAYDSYTDKNGTAFDGSSGNYIIMNYNLSFGVSF